MGANLNQLPEGWTFEDSDQGNGLPSGWSFEEEKPKEEKGIIEKGARLAGQFALGVAESAALPYELGVAPLASKEAMTIQYRQSVMEDIERLEMQKLFSGLDEQDQGLLDHLVDQIKNPQKAEQFVQTMDASLRGLAEKATGLDLAPEGFAEKTASMVGFIKDPKKLSGVLKYGLKPKEVIKSILPNVSEVLRGIGIEGGLEIAEDGGYGPIGKLGAMIIGDLSGASLAKGVKTGKEFLKDPKKMLAEVAASFSKNEKQELQKEIIESFREQGIQPDLGTITDNNLIKMTQARLSQSGLVGKDLDKFKENLFSEIRESYQKVANDVGELKHATNYEAGLIGKEMVKDIQRKDLAEVRNIYRNAEDALSEKAFVDPSKIYKTTERLEKSLSPGQLKSEEQRKVLEVISTLKRDISDSSGAVMFSNVKDLINNKIALNDMINYEVQGGTKQLLKELVGDIDRAIISHGKDNPRFAKSFISANKRFSEHAKTFRNKEISRLLREEDPSKLFNRMNSVDGIKKIGNILNKTKEGKEIFEQLKRKKLEDLFNNSFIGNLEGQIKLGTFSNALEKGNTKEIAKEILGKRNFEKLKNIQKNAGILNETAQKFFNASQSGVVAADVAIVAKYLMDIGHLLSGNPWPFAKTTGGFVLAKNLSSLMSDPGFLKIVEDIIIQGKKKNPRELYNTGKKLLPYIKFLEEQNQQEQDN